MQFSALSVAAVLGLAGQAAAFWGQMAASDYYHTGGEGVIAQDVFLTDYNTGSTYKATFDGFNSCPAPSGYVCTNVQFVETSPGGYNFVASLWRTSDGCHNIDFRGGLGAGHGWCCGSLPCDIGA